MKYFSRTSLCIKKSGFVVSFNFPKHILILYPVKRNFRLTQWINNRSLTQNFNRFASALSCESSQITTKIKSKSRELSGGWTSFSFSENLLTKSLNRPRGLTIKCTLRILWEMKFTFIWSFTGFARLEILWHVWLKFSGP